MLKKQISLKDPQIKILIITIAVVITSYICNQKLIQKPHREKTAKLKANLEHIRIEDEIARIYDEVNKCEKCLPPQKEPSWLLTQITEMAKNSKLDIESIEPLPPKQIPPYSYIPFKIRTTCTFKELVNFIELVESSPYILSIESLKLESIGRYSPEVPKEELDKEIPANINIVIGTIY